MSRDQFAHEERQADARSAARRERIAHEAEAASKGSISDGSAALDALRTEAAELRD